MQNLPRVGLILLRAEWFDDVVSLPQLEDAVLTDAQFIQKQLDHKINLLKVWKINSNETLNACIRDINSTEIDLIILAFQVWAEDYYLPPLVHTIGDIPLMLWCYLPWEHPPRPMSFEEVLRGSGPVGTFEGLGTLHNLGASFTFTHGSPYNENVQKEISVSAQAVYVRNSLKSAHFGLLPSWNEQMQSTYVDETRLLYDIGPKVQQITIRALKNAVDLVEEQETEYFTSELLKNYELRGTSKNALRLACQTSLGLGNLVMEQGIDLLSINDVSSELHEVIGLRPCLYPPVLKDKGKLISLEGDLGAATAMYMMHLLTGKPCLFTEIWFWDEEENLIVGGHAGIHNPDLAHQEKIWISQDYEYAQTSSTVGAHYQFVSRPGRVTLLQLRATQSGWQALLTGGEALDVDPWIEGYPHAVVRLDTNIDHFLHSVAKLGSTQHWIMGYGDLQLEIQSLFGFLGFPLEFIN